MTLEKIRVMLVHRAKLFREGVASILDREPQFEVVATFTSGHEAIEKVDQLQPDVILLDEGAKGCTCAEATEQMSKLVPNAKIIILTYPWRTTDPIDMLKLGAKAFISKDIAVEELIKGISLVHAGGLVIFSPMTEKIYEALVSQPSEHKMAKPDYYANLTEREKQVMAMAVEGKTNKQIAEGLLMSEHTVSVHMRWIMAKLHVRNRQQIVALAVGKALNSGHRVVS
jgi:DNA-binding NarL/FixJ family response regulator